MRDAAHDARTVSVGGLGLRVRESGDGAPLLLINGIGAHLEMWRPLEARLAGRRLVAFDAPGTGGSDTTPLPLSMDALSDLTASLLDELGYQRVDVLGYSFGGVLAQRLAARAPARVRRLVLVATTPGWGGVPGSLLTMARMTTPLRYYSRTHYEAIAGELMGGRARRDADFVRQQGRHRRHAPPDPLGYLWQLAAVAGSRNPLRSLGSIDMPALVLTGDDDPIVPPANALLLAHHLPRARLVTCGGEGHLLLASEDSAALPAIDEFLDAPDAERSAVWMRAEDVSAARVTAALRGEWARWTNPWALLNAAVRAGWAW